MTESSTSKSSYVAPCVEEYDSARDDENLNKANTKLKRSSDLSQYRDDHVGNQTPATEKPDGPKKSSQQSKTPSIPVDLASDSGYSSRTNMTADSADSSFTSRSSAKSGSSTVKPSHSQKAGSSAEAVPARRRAATSAATSTHTPRTASHELPVPPATSSVNVEPSDSRTTSRASKTKRVCAEPNCDKCVAARQARRAKEAVAAAKGKAKESARPPPSPRPSNSRRESNSTQASRHLEPPPTQRRRSSTSAQPRPPRPYTQDPYIAPPHARPFASPHPHASHTYPILPPGAHGMPPPMPPPMMAPPPMQPRRPPMQARMTDTNMSARRSGATPMRPLPDGKQLSARRVAQPTRQPVPQLEYFTNEDEEDSQEDESDEDEEDYDSEEEDEDSFDDEEDEDDSEEDSDLLSEEEDDSDEDTEELKARIVKEEFERRMQAGKQQELHMKHAQAQAQAQAQAYALAQAQAQARAQMPPPAVPASRMSMRHTGTTQQPVNDPRLANPYGMHQVPTGLGIPQHQAGLGMPMHDPMHDHHNVVPGFPQRRPSMASSSEQWSYPTTSSSSPRVGQPHPSMRHRRQSRASNTSPEDLEQQQQGIEAYIQASISEKVSEVIDAHYPKQAKRQSTDFTDVSAIIEREVAERLKKLGLQPEPKTMSFEERVREDLKARSRAGADGMPLTEAALRQNRRRAAPSEDGSVITSDTRASRTGKGIAKMRVNLENGFEIEHEGQRIAIQPTGDGSYDLNLETVGEDTHHSTRGSVKGTPKSSASRVPRHERRYREDDFAIEEETVRQTPTRVSRRDRDRHRQPEIVSPRSDPYRDEDEGHDDYPGRRPAGYRRTTVEEFPASTRRR